MDAALDVLFASPIGLLSLFTLLFIVGMKVFLSAWLKRKMDKPEE
jgi:hypothetical protein